MTDEEWSNDPDWQRHMRAMMKAEKLLPPEPMWNTGVVQVLAEVLTRAEPHLSDADYATLVGIGGIIVREANRETMAGLEAFFAIRRAGGGR